MKAWKLRLLLLALSLLLLSLSCAPKTAAPAASPGRGPVVAFLEGEVKVDGAAVEPGAKLPARIDVVTGPGAALDIVFSGGNNIHVGQNAVASLDFSSPSVEVRLSRGGVTSVLRKLEKLTDKDSFSIRAGSAVASVRGTSFCVWADASSTYVCACNGTVRTVAAGGGKEFTLSATHHVAKLYTSQDGSVAVVDAGMEHHDDALVEAVARRIGAEIDWTRLD